MAYIGILTQSFVMGDENAGKANAQNHNIVFIIVDDLRPALGCYGDTKAFTPNIDRFAEHSFVFQHAYAQVKHSIFFICCFSSLISFLFCHCCVIVKTQINKMNGIYIFSKPFVHPAEIRCLPAGDRTHCISMIFIVIGEILPEILPHFRNT